MWNTSNLYFPGLEPEWLEEVTSTLGRLCENDLGAGSTSQKSHPLPGGERAERSCISLAAGLPLQWQTSSVKLVYPALWREHVAVRVCKRLPRTSLPHSHAAAFAHYPLVWAPSHWAPVPAAPAPPASAVEGKAVPQTICLKEKIWKGRFNWAIIQSSPRT